MKKVLLVFAVIVLCGCYSEAPKKRNGTNLLFIETVRGHDYVIYDGYNKGGIVHAESCQCKRKEKIKQLEEEL